MAKKVVAVAMDINKIPYINDAQVILTPGKQKIWYTVKTQPIEIPAYIKLSDKVINSFIKKFLKKSKKQDILQFNYFTNRVARYLKTHSYDEIVFENYQLKNKILPNFKNNNEYVINKKEALSVNG